MSKPKPKPKPPTRLLSSAELADLLGVTRKSIARWRRDGGGPAYYRLARGVVRYSRAEVDSWLESKRRKSTAHDNAISGPNRDRATALFGGPTQESASPSKATQTSSIQHRGPSSVGQLADAEAGGAA